MLEVKNEFNTFNWGKKNALSPEFQRIYLTEEKNASGLKFIKNCLPPQRSGGGIDTFDSGRNQWPCYLHHITHETTTEIQSSACLGSSVCF